MQKYVVVVAGGSGRRMKREIPKQFISVAGKPILMHTLEAFHRVSNQIQIILVLPESQILGWKSLCAQYNFTLPHSVAKGGETRFHSVKNGLAKIEDDGLVAIHDGVRPMVTEQIILNSFAVAEQKGNAVAAVALKDSIRTVKDGTNQVANRNEFQLIQTPQTFNINLIKAAFEAPYSTKFTDDATVLEAMGHQINLIEGDYSNIKITTPEDLVVAESMLKQES